MSMTDIDQVVVEKVRRAMHECGVYPHPGDVLHALQAIDLPDLLRKEREYDALMARVEAAPVAQLGANGGNLMDIADDLGYYDGQRVRLLVEQEG